MSFVKQQTNKQTAKRNIFPALQDRLLQNRVVKTQNSVLRTATNTDHTGRTDAYIALLCDSKAACRVAARNHDERSPLTSHRSTSSDVPNFCCNTFEHSTRAVCAMLQSPASRSADSCSKPGQFTWDLWCTN